MSNEMQNCRNDEDSEEFNMESDTSIETTGPSKQPKTSHCKCDKTSRKIKKVKIRKTSDRSDKPIKKICWKRMVPHLPSWLKTNPIVAITDTQGSTSKPSHSSKKSRSWKRSSLQCIQHGICPICSHERVLSTYDFEDMISAHKTAFERWTEKGMAVWTKLIKLGTSESDQETKKNTLGQTGSCKTNKEALKASLIKLFLNDKSCKRCKKEQLGPSSKCQEFLLKQTWAYLQKISSEHKKECQHCNQKLPSTLTLTGKRSHNSNDCKKPQLEKARAYLNKKISEHNTSCERCKQKQSNAKNKSNDLITLENMLEQAWIYFRKLGSGHNDCLENFNRKEEHVICLSLSATELEKQCCLRYQQMAKILCFKYPTAIEMDKSSSQSCKGPSNEPIIINGNFLGVRSCCTTCFCPGCEKCPAENIRRNAKSCPSVCKNPVEVPDKNADEPEEKTQDTEEPNEEKDEEEQSHKRARHAPPPTCCHQPAPTSSHQPIPSCCHRPVPSCCHNPSPSCCCPPRDDHLKLPKSMGSPDSFNSNLFDPNDSPCIGPCQKLSGLSHKACEILGIPKECCTADKSKEVPKERSTESIKKKSGITLTKEPQDHKFCSRSDCIHSKENLGKCPPEPKKCPAEPPKCPAEPPKCPEESTICPGVPQKCAGVLPKCLSEPPKSPGESPKCPGLAPICPGEPPKYCTSEPCTAACSKEDGYRQPCCCKNPSPPRCPPPKVCSVACTAGCSKSNSIITLPMYEDKRPADTEYDALLNEFTAKEVKDKETIYETDSDFLTSLGELLPKETDIKKNKRKADPHNYRYYY